MKYHYKNIFWEMCCNVAMDYGYSLFRGFIGNMKNCGSNIKMENYEESLRQKLLNLGKIIAFPLLAVDEQKQNLSNVMEESFQFSV